jgi:general stress protein 26
VHDEGRRPYRPCLGGHQEGWHLHDGHALCWRPSRAAVEVRPDRDNEAIWFLTDVRGLKDDEVKVDPNVCLTFVYPKEKVYLSVTGKALVNRDPERAKMLWNKEQQVWWPEDPNLLVMKVEPERAEMWDGWPGPISLSSSNQAMVSSYVLFNVPFIPFG